MKKILNSIYNFFRRMYFDFFVHGGWRPTTWPNGIKARTNKLRMDLIIWLGGYLDPPNTSQNISSRGVFNYGDITEGQKSVVEELLTRLKQDSNISFVLDDEYVSWIKREFKIEEVNRFNIENSAFWQWANQKGYYTPIQGWIKEGQGPEAIEYPIIATNMDIRQYDKMMSEFIQMGKDSARDI